MNKKKCKFCGRALKVVINKFSNGSGGFHEVKLYKCTNQLCKLNKNFPKEEYRSCPRMF